MGEILFLIYLIAGYWAAGETIYANKIRVGTLYGLFITRFTMAIFLGWLLIPWAILKMIFFK